MPNDKMRSDGAIVKDTFVERSSSGLYFLDTSALSVAEKEQLVKILKREGVGLNPQAEYESPIRIHGEKNVSKFTSKVEGPYKNKYYQELKESKRLESERAAAAQQAEQEKPVFEAPPLDADVNQAPTPVQPAVTEQSVQPTPEELSNPIPSTAPKSPVVAASAPSRDASEAPSEVMNSNKMTPEYASELVAAGKKSIQQENLLGSGLGASVYSIPGHEDYVIRVEGNADISSINNITLAQDIFEGRNVGQPILQGTNFQILKRQTGISPRTFIKEKTEEYRAQNASHPETRAIKDLWEKMADFPEETFDNLYKDLEAASRAGYNIDKENCNYVVDFESNPPRIGLVDLAPRNTNEPCVNNINEMRYSIMSTWMENTPIYDEWAMSKYQEGIYRKNEDATGIEEDRLNARKKLTVKIEEAGERQNVPADRAASTERYNNVKPRRMYPDESISIAQFGATGIDTHGTNAEGPENASFMQARELMDKIPKDTGTEVNVLDGDVNKQSFSPVMPTENSSVDAAPNQHAEGTEHLSVIPESNVISESDSKESGHGSQIGTESVLADAQPDAGASDEPHVILEDPGTMPHTENALAGSDQVPIGPVVPDEPIVVLDRPHPETALGSNTALNDGWILEASQEVPTADAYTAHEAHAGEATVTPADAPHKPVTPLINVEPVELLNPVTLAPVIAGAAETVKIAPTHESTAEGSSTRRNNSGYSFTSQPLESPIPNEPVAEGSPARRNSTGYSFTAGTLADAHSGEQFTEAHSLFGENSMASRFIDKAHTTLKEANKIVSAHPEGHALSGVTGSAVGLAMGGKGLYEDLVDEHSEFNANVKKGGGVGVAAKVKLGADATGVLSGMAELGIQASQYKPPAGLKMPSLVSAPSPATIAVLEDLQYVDDIAKVASGASKVAKATKSLGVIGTATTVVAGVATGAVGHLEGDGHKVASAAGSTAGALAGGLAGAKLGAMAGAAVGVWFGGVGAVPAAAVGGFIGGMAGAIGGAVYGGEAADYVAGDAINNTETYKTKRAQIAAAKKEQTLHHGPMTAAEISADMKKLVPAMERGGWGGRIGDGDNHIDDKELQELRQSLAKKGVVLDKDGDGHISGKEMEVVLYNVPKVNATKQTSSTR